MESIARILPYFRRSGRRRAESPADYDRLDTSKGASDGREPFNKGPIPRRIGRTKGGLNSKLHVVCDQNGRPLQMLLSEGQLSNHVGARLMFDAMPRANALIADKGYDSDDFRQALEECGVTPFIPSRRNRKALMVYDKALYKTRHKIENLFAKLKDWSVWRQDMIAVLTPSSRRFV